MKHSSDSSELMIFHWRQNVVGRVKSAFDEKNYMRRKEYFDPEISLRQYQSLLAFTEEWGFQRVEDMSSEDKRTVFRHTIGTQYKDHDDAALEALAHEQRDTLSKIYDLEVKKALDDMSL